LLSENDCWCLWIGENPPQGERLVALGSDPKAVAARLYATLHEADDAGAVRIVVAGLPSDVAWAAVADRLRRAAVTQSASEMDAGKK
jgi:L-threonylcarbamoyladenylate synthase